MQCDSVISKCKQILNEISIIDAHGFASMESDLREYLHMSASNIKNSDRQPTSAYILWRNKKQELRQLVSNIFYPQSIISCAYKQGITFIEKVCKKNRGLQSKCTNKIRHVLLHILVVRQYLYSIRNI